MNKDHWLAEQVDDEIEICSELFELSQNRVSHFAKSLEVLWAHIICFGFLEMLT